MHIKTNYRSPQTEVEKWELETLLLDISSTGEDLVEEQMDPWV